MTIVEQTRTPFPRDERWATAEELLGSIDGLSAREIARRRRDAAVLALDLPDMVARRYRNRGIDQEDLVQVARLALVKAVRGYRADRGQSFAAFAVPTISGEIKRYFRDQGWAVRPPRRLQERRAELLAAQELLRHERRHEPTRVELADELGWDPEEVSDVQECCAAYTSQSVDEPGSASDAAERFAVPDTHVERLALRDALTRGMDELTDRERTIVRMRFIDECTQAEIGAALGISQMQVSRLLSSILRQLRLAIGLEGE